MMKLLLWLSYGEIMKVGEGKNFGIPHDKWVFCGLAGCCFFQLMPVLWCFLWSVKESLKVKKSVPKSSKYKDR